MLTDYLSFENEDDRTSYYKYYMPSVEIKDYNVLIDGNAFLELPIKNLEETYEKIIQITVAITVVTTQEVIY